ncbi:unnamed protein product, partial [Rotaria magnacalcarata]
MPRDRVSNSFDEIQEAANLLPGYHNRLNSRICRNHPDVWDLINFMKGEEKRVERIKLQWPSGAPKPKNIRTIALQSRINTLYDRYKNYRIAASDLLN